MLKDQCIRAVVYAATAMAVFVILLPFAQMAQAQEDKLPEGDWCGTQVMYDAKIRAADGGAASPQACTPLGPCDDPGTRDTFIPDSTDEIKIVRLYFHVMRNDDGSNPAASEQDVADQVALMNQNYLPYRIQFDYLMRFVNSSAFRSLTSNAEFNQMKSAYAIAPDSFCNIYVASVNVNGDVFSFGTFPWDADALTVFGGIVMNRTQFGAFDPWGGTITHEMGHVLGLWHTHHGVDEVAQCGSCYEEAQGPDRDFTGDFCADTDPTPTNFNCAPPGGNDPCSGFAWGTTDFRNYMGYAPSSCYTHFTNQQAGRIRCWMNDVLTSWLINAQIAADTTFGPVPLTVNFTGTSPKSVNQWLWNFGDGDTSIEQNPTHTYTAPGVYNVTLDIETTDSTNYTTVNANYIYALAETLVVADVQGGVSQSVRVDVSINNHVPLLDVTIPFTWAGPLALSFDSASTVGLRTSNLTTENGGIFTVNNDFSNQRAIRELRSGNQPIEPGSGPILSLYFKTPPFMLTGENPIELISYGLKDPSAETDPGTFLAETISGSITMSCCVGTVGNVNGDPNDVVDIADLTILIDHLFINFTSLPCDPEANINGDPGGVIDIADLTVLIDHLFINFTPLPTCP